MEQERAFKGERLYAGRNEGALVSADYSLRVDNAKWLRAGEAAILSDHFYLEWMMFRDEDVEYARPNGEYVTSHAVIFVPPGQRIRARWKGGRIRTVSCCFRPRLLKDRPELLQNLMNLDGDHLFNLRSAFLESGLCRIADETVSPGFDSDFMVRSLLQALCSDLHRTASTGRDEPAIHGALSPSQLRTLQQLLRETDGKLPTADDLAHRCSVMPRALSSLVKGATGMGLRHFIAHERLSRARDLLDDRRMMIKQVAFSCGFASPASFSAAFRKATGMTPAEYRNRS
ncbi:helix-turn-helix transcriptional regulator [Sphingobium sp. CFD-1]|uniref:helix-turn-helix transcriptional regulator n=1 Tax=Sphingobium sp. CFD-1 TaxID=2878545 RepID=UPI00214B27DF|nr:helix-turn-helix transcriptional regulator [Sphingobium sp. CFD-1]